MEHTTYSQIPNIQELIEVIDSNDKPIMIIHKEQANLKTILHRVVALVLHNSKKQNLIIYKTIKGSNNYILDFPTISVVRAGESRIDAALRALSPIIKDISLIEGGNKATSPEKSNILNNLHITLFFAKIGNELIYYEHKNLKDSIFLDRDELIGIATHSPSLLSDMLHWAISSNALFEQNIN